MKQAAWPGKDKIQKGPYFLKSWSLQTPFYRSVLYFANLLLCSAAILPKGEREKGSEKTARKKAALFQEPDPVTEMQKAKPGLLVTSVTSWFIEPAPFPCLLLASTAWPPSAICLIVTACQHLRQAGTAFTRTCLFEL